MPIPREEAPSKINFLFEDVGFCTSITRAHFEELCSDLFCTPLEPVEDDPERCQADQGPNP